MSDALARYENGWTWQPAVDAHVKPGNVVVLNCHSGCYYGVVISIEGPCDFFPGKVQALVRGKKGPKRKDIHGSPTYWKG